MIFNRKLIIVLFSVLLLQSHSNMAIGKVVALPQNTEIKVLTQPDGVKFKVIYIEVTDAYAYKLNIVSRLVTIKKGIPIVKNSRGFYVLATVVALPPDYLRAIAKPTEVRADSPFAYKKKVNGQWRFFISGTNKEVSYGTKKAILPDWPDGSTAIIGGIGGITPPDIYFTGKFNPDGSPIYYSPKNKRFFSREEYYKSLYRQYKRESTYRTPFAGSIDWWFIAIAFFCLWKRRCR